MNRILCNIIIKIIHNWELKALNNGLLEVARECVFAQEYLVHIKEVMIKKKTWK